MSATDPEAREAMRVLIVETLLGHGYRTFNLGTPRQYTQYGGWNQSCTCGHPLGDAGGDGGDERVDAAHRAHLADVLLGLWDGDES